MSKLPKKVNIDFKNIFYGGEKLTFLVGAGCSVDQPSCLPSGRSMMDAIIRYTCAKSEINKIIKIEDLRFETLVEIVRDRLDNELKIIDYFGECDKPNLQHFFLADMIKNGNFVMTTNFDSLIEQALLQSNVSKNEIIPIITREDFEKNSNPTKLYQQGKKTLYKIHGSTKNFITGKSTKDSLIATIQAFGSNKTGENVFQLENFKRQSFENLTKGRSLVIMGYSGSDDFDIVPTLSLLRDLNNIYWINYTHEGKGKHRTLEIFENTDPSFDKKKEINSILVDIKRMTDTKHVYRIDVNTSRLIQRVFSLSNKLSQNNFNTDPIEWLKKHITAPDIILSLQIPYKIYDSLSMIDDALRCSEKILSIAKKQNNQEWISIALNNIGTIYDARSDYPEALKHYQKALEIDEELNDLQGKAIRLSNIGSVQQSQSAYSEALNSYTQALKLADQLGNLRSKAIDLNNIGSIYHAQGNYQKALKFYMEALQIDEQLGDLNGKAMRLSNIGTIHQALGNFSKALEYTNESLQIADQLGDLYNKGTRLSGIAMIYSMQGNHEDALKLFDEAIEISERLGDLRGKAVRLNNTGLIYKALENYSEALERFENALQIAEQVGDLSGKASCLNNIALIYKAREQYSEALKRYQEALHIAEKINDSVGMAARLHNIGALYDAQGDRKNALKMINQSLKINKKLNAKPNIAINLWRLGTIYTGMNNKAKARSYLQQAMEYYQNLGLQTEVEKLKNEIKSL
ncbi:MAG: tetratricopeptide repeat protein [Promethearchaeota archaeon]|nr:MAG: tetratricopeptide repeat protein [Candidatus Lokiarchaeota archaeon]